MKENIKVYLRDSALYIYRTLTFILPTKKYGVLYNIVYLLKYT